MAERKMAARSATDSHVPRRCRRTPPPPLAESRTQRDAQPRVASPPPGYRTPGRLAVASRKRSHQLGSGRGSGGGGGGGQDGSGKGRPGKAALPLRPASRPDSAIWVRSPNSALPRISFRGGGLGERNSGGCRDSGASKAWRSHQRSLELDILSRTRPFTQYRLQQYTLNETKSEGCFLKGKFIFYVMGPAYYSSSLDIYLAGPLELFGQVILLADLGVFGVGCLGVEVASARHGVL
ncbi:hypothetical protein J1605_021802 [Eschrichtius robustus]|uniref:Uncharacterized protein n=1 Tax=Eschrichtius robustus TaxID=9764 RepID=A0AB34HEF2_ESCRO|nr:hypothetical protein J1605_021802 [Eschrichtius robustus]